MSLGDATAERPTPTTNSLLGDVWVNFKRWNRKTLRNPTVVVLEVAMATLTLVVFTAVFGEAGALALEQTGFGDVAYVTFLLPAVVLQVTMASAFSSGLGLVADLESGMFEKVIATPMRWTGVFVGKAASELLRITVQLLVVFALAFAMGAEVQTGIVGVLGILLVCLLFALWYMGLANVLALLTRDTESLDAASMLLLFPLLFLSSSFLPVSALSGWTETVATYNPVTYGVDAVRALVLDQHVLTVVSVDQFGGIFDTLVPALGVLVVLNVVFGATAIWMLSRATSSSVA